jgi:deazaflavin-dependent oxidoreductase (nitroreductase family)
MFLIEMRETSGEIDVPRKGTRGSRFVGGVLMRLMQPVFRRQVVRFAQASGPEQPTFNGFPVLLLTTVGAKTGRERTHALGGFPDGEDSWLIVASKGGAADHPAWFYNLAKNPDKVWVQVGNRRFRAQCESLVGAEREDAYARVAKLAPVYAAYPKKTDREIPVIRVRPAATTS